MIATADQFLTRLAVRGGRAVCTGDLTHFQLAEAKVNDTLYVDADGMGYAIVPWNLTTHKDKVREGLADPPSAPSAEQKPNEKPVT